MYHALVNIDGQWGSVGLHIPSYWTNVFHTLNSAYGPENVRYLFWTPDDRVDDVAAVRAKAESDVRYANMAQSRWDAGELMELADMDGSLHLSRGIALLRQTAA